MLSLSPEKLRPLHYILLALFCFALYLPGQSTLPSTDRDESRFAQASKQMVETGNLTDIHFQEETRYKKPIGIYWLQSASAEIAHLVAGAELNEIWIYRIPSLLAAIGAVLMTTALGARLFTPAIGLSAGLMLAASLMLNVEARLGKTDATLLLTVITAQYALAGAWLNRAPSRNTTLLFWLAMGAGTMIKGPIILIPIIATIAVLCWREKNAKLLKNLQPHWGVLVYLLVVLPWLVAITLKSGGAFWQQSVGHDMMSKISSGQESHALPPLYYTVSFWAMFWPGSVLAFLAIPFIWQERKQEKIALLLAWWLPFWVIFEAVPTKLPHYVLPTYPAIALLAATALHTSLKPFAQRWLAPLGWAAWAIVSAGIAVGAAILPHLAHAVMGWAQIAAAVLALALLGLWFARRNTPHKVWQTALLPVASFIVLAPLAALTLPSLDRVWIARQVQTATQDAGCRAPQLVSAGFNEPSLVFLNGTATKLNATGEEAANYLADNRIGCRFALVDQANMPGFTATIDRLGLQVQHMSVIAGFNYTRGKPVDLQLLRLVNGTEAPE